LYAGSHERVVTSTVTRRGQTVMPAELRRRYRVGMGTRLEWIDTGQDLRVIPLPADIIGTLRGVSKGEQLGEKLRQARTRDRRNEKRR
jgi:bifunctional DNA-binding transcriptional regulator/antitoxin component of YhaV-PrlF toxin-antitoxin module